MAFSVGADKAIDCHGRVMARALVVWRLFEVGAFSAQPFAAEACGAERC